VNPTSPSQKKRIGLLCLIAIAAVLFGTLWPFNPFPRNDVDWLPEANGIQFGPPGLVLSNAPLQAPQEIQSEKSCTLELLVRPATIADSGNILTFFVPENPEKFVVRQWTDGLLVVHKSVNAQGKIKSAKFDVDHAFSAGKLLLLTITSGPQGTIVYRDAKLARSFPRFAIAPSEFAGQIILGTSPVDFWPWQGEVRGLAIYSKELTPSEVLQHYNVWTAVPPIAAPDLDGALARYSFGERRGRSVHSAVTGSPDLQIPTSYNVPHKAMLTSAIKEFRRSRDYLMDVLLNIAGFVPLGVILGVYFSLTRPRLQAIFYATLVGALLSFTIEVAQAYIPSRVSGCTDIITNTLGTLLGAAIARPDFVRKLLQIIKVLPAEKYSSSAQS
jgi:VanZ family protein